MIRKKYSAFVILCIFAFITFVFCDIGEWDITRSQESQRNVDAFEEIDFLTGEILSGPRAGQHIEGRVVKELDEDGNVVSETTIGVGAYPLVFGTSTNYNTCGILGSGNTRRAISQTPTNTQINHIGVNIELPEASPHRGNPHFPNNRIPDVIPPGFFEVAALGSNIGGKIAGSEDGITFLFREVPLDRHFILEADFLIVSYGNTLAGSTPPHMPGSNGQEGFGIMVRDFVPQIPNSSRSGTTMVNFENAPQGAGITGHRWRLGPDIDDPEKLLSGMGQAISQQFHSGAAGHGADANMIMAGGTKRGMNVYIREGITRGPMTHDGFGNPTMTGTQNPAGARFSWWPPPLGDYSFFLGRENETLSGERAPVFAARPSFPRWGSTVRIRLERTNDGFKYRIENLDDRFDDYDTDTGRLLRPNVQKPIISSDQWGIVRDWDILGQVNNSFYYVGFFAARDASVWVHNISYREVNANQTAPAKPVYPTPLDPKIEVVSPPFYTGVNTIYLTSNTAGRISVIQDGVRIPDNLITNEWLTGKENGTAEPMSFFTVPIHEPKSGGSVFDVIFQPGKLPQEHVERNFAHSSNNAVRMTFNIARRDYNSGETELGKDGGQASIIFVAPVHIPGSTSVSGVWGRTDGDGTRSNPLDLQTAINHVKPGQHIVMLDGRYVMNRMITIPSFNNGTQDKMKVLRAQNVNRVWLDWDKREDLGPLHGNGTLGGEGFLLRGSFWHLDGFHIRGTPDKTKGIVIGGSNNLLTRMMTYNIGDTGMQMSYADSIPVRFWPRDNKVMWSESFNNIDAAQTDADGFAAKLTVGERNVFYSSISHHNNDDGWDLFSKRESGPIGEVLIEYSVAYRQGFMLNNHRTAGGGIGFKMGGEGIGIFHLIRQSLSFGNPTQIGSNSNPNLLVRYATVANLVGNAAGNVNITSPTGIAVGNVFNSVATVSRAGGAASGTNTTSFHPEAARNWQDFLINRPPEFWGTGNSGGMARIVVNTRQGEASLIDGTGNATNDNGLLPEGFKEIVEMPSDYSQWTSFKRFLPRDGWFAYPIVQNETHGLLYRPPDGIGAYGIYNRKPADVEAEVKKLIPWAVYDASRGY